MSDSDMKEQSDGDEKVTLCVKVPRKLLKKIDEIKNISRSEFVRIAIIEKLSSSEESIQSELTLLRNQMKTLEKRVKFLEMELKAKSSHKPPSENELYRFCRDDKDRKIVSLLLENGYVKAPELEPILGLKRRQITNRIKRLALTTNAIQFVPGYKNGIKKAWWLTIKKSSK